MHHKYNLVKNKTMNLNSNLKIIGSILTIAGIIIAWSLIAFIQKVKEVRRRGIASLDVPIEVPTKSR